MTTVVFVLSGTSVTIPSDWTSGNNSVEPIGGGGGGTFPCGGGGGEYRKNINQSYTQGASRTCQIGAGGAGSYTANGTAGTSTSIKQDDNATTGTLANGGGGATFNNATPPAGGTAGTGSAANSNGGAGGTGTLANCAPGTGGGGAGGPSGVGGAGGLQVASTVGACGGAGGGGSNGGVAGTAQTNTLNAAGTSGGNGQGGSGGGTGGTSGTTPGAGGAGTAGTGAGGGGGGANNNNSAANGSGGVGAASTLWTQTSNSATAGPGGGGGGSGGNGGEALAGTPGNGGLYGGAAGGVGNFGTTAGAAFSGAAGILVLTYAATQSVTVSKGMPRAWLFTPAAFKRGPARGLTATASTWQPTYYFVSPTGSDSNNGLTPSTPWQTIGKVNGFSFPAGAIICFQGGQSFSGGPITASANGTVILPITYQSYGAGQATITCTNAQAGFTGTNVSNIIVSNLIFTGGGNSSSTTNGIWFKNSVTSSSQANITIRNCTVSLFGACGIAISDETAAQSGTFNNVTISNNTVHDCTGFAAQGGSNVTESGTNAAINICGGGTTQFTNVVVSLNTIYNCPGFAGATAGNNTGQAIGINLTTGCTVSYNYCHDGGGSNTTVANSGILLYQSSNVTVSFNEVARWSGATSASLCSGIDIDDQCSGCIIEYNYVHEVVGQSLSILNITNIAWDNNVVRFNVTQNGSFGELIIGPNGHAMTNSYVYNNTFYNNLTQPIVVDQTTSTVVGSSLVVANNIFDQGGAAKFIAFAHAGSGITFLNNNYFGASATGFTWAGTAYATIALWRAGVATQETISAVNVAKSSDPAFTGPVPRTSGIGNDLGGYIPASLTNYKVSAPSPMIGSGLDMATTYTIAIGSQDFWGDSLPASPGPFTIGAYFLSGGSNFYVSTSGDDANDGLTTSTTWLTIARVNAYPYPAGATINFNGGQTFTGGPITPSNNGVSGGPTTYQSYGAGQATISAVNANSGVLATGISNVTINNLAVTGGGGGTSTTNAIWFKNSAAATVSNITVSNCTITAFGGCGVAFSSEVASANWTGLTVSNCAISNCLSNANLGGASNFAGGASGVVCSGFGAGSNFTNVLITLNNIHDCTGFGSSAGGTAAIQFSSCTGTNVVASFNYCHDCGSGNTGGIDAIATFQATNVTITSNEVARWSGGAFSGGIDIDSTCSNCIIEYCYVHECVGQNISIGAFAGSGTWATNIVRYNVTQNGTQGELVICPFAAMTGVEVYNNTFISTVGQTMIGDQHAQGAASTVTGNITNNIFYQGAAALFMDINANGTWTGNCWYGPTATGFKWGGVTSATLAAWQTATGQEKISGSLVGTTINPAFTGPVPRPTGIGNDLGGYFPALLGNYRLGPNSPMIGTGLNINTLYGYVLGSQDFWGNPTVDIYVAFDIGAFSFPGPALVSTLLPHELFAPGRGPTRALRPTQAFPAAIITGAVIDSPQGETIFRVRHNYPYLGRGQLG